MEYCMSQSTRRRRQTPSSLIFLNICMQVCTPRMNRERNVEESPKLGFSLHKEGHIFFDLWPTRYFSDFLWNIFACFYSLPVEFDNTSSLQNCHFKLTFTEVPHTWIFSWFLFSKKIQEKTWALAMIITKYTEIRQKRKWKRQNEKEAKKTKGKWIYKGE